MGSLRLKERIDIAHKAARLSELPSFFFDHILVQTTNDNYWRIWEPLYYYSRKFGCVFEVEPGFVSDLASLPAISRVIFNRNGPSKLPSILHDRGYETGGILCVYRVECLHTLRQMLRDYSDYRTLVHADETLALVETRALSRFQIDQLFLESMAATGCPRFEQLAFYHAVRAGGSRRFGASKLAEAVKLD